MKKAAGDWKMFYSGLDARRTPEENEFSNFVFLSLLLKSHSGEVGLSFQGGDAF